MNIEPILPQPLTCEGFSAFGDVIAVSDNAEHFTINDGFTERYHNLAKLDLTAELGQAGVSIFRSTPLQRVSNNITIKMMERHPLSSQAFMPLGNEPYLVVVAPKGEFDIAQLKVFIASNNQGVNYHAGTWHHYCLALNKVSDFLVIDRIGKGDNCDVITLDGSHQIDITPFVSLKDNH